MVAVVAVTATMLGEANTNMTIITNTTHQQIGHPIRSVVVMVVAVCPWW